MNEIGITAKNMGKMQSLMMITKTTEKGHMLAPALMQRLVMQIFVLTPSFLCSANDV